MKTAAPLKQSQLYQGYLTMELHLRGEDRGPVEAPSAPRRGTGAATHLRGEDRGPVEAGVVELHWTSGTRHLRGEDRGPVEASSP